MDNDTIKILLIEDNEDDIFFIKKALKDKKYQIKIITSGNEAYDYLINPETPTPDVILLDYHLPGMSGLEILSNKDINKLSQACIFLSVDNSIDTVRKAMKAGALDFIPKTADLKLELPEIVEKVYAIHKEILDKKRIEKELRKNEEKWHSLISNATDTILIVEQNGIIKYINRSPIPNISLNEFVGKKVYEFLVEDDREFAMQHVQNAFLCGRTGNFESKVIFPSGEKRWLSIRVGLIKENDEIVGVSLITTDITQKKKAEQELRNKNQELKQINEKYEQVNTQLKNNQNYLTSIFKTAPVGIGVKTNKLITFANDQLSEMLEYKKNELLGKNEIVLYTSKKEYENVNTLIDNQLRESGFGTVETNWTTKSGKILDILLSTSLINPENNMEGATFTALDISERNRYVQALQESEETFRAMTENSPDIIMRFDKNKRHVYVNQQVNKLSNKKASEYIGKNHAELGFPEYLCTYWDDEISSVFKSKKGSESLFYYMLDKNEIIFESRMVPEFNEAGEVKSVLTILRDVTGQKQNEEALIKAKEQAEESDRLKSAFLANMSHEIRTPMNGIIGFSQLLSNPVLSADKRIHFSGIIKKRSEDLLRIINDILDISKIEAGQLQIRETEFSIHEMFDELNEIQHQKLINDKKAHIKLFDTREFNDKTDYIIADSLRVKQLLTNLIDNAIKFTDSGSVEFGYQLIKSSVIEFYVKDTGIGITDAEQKVIFERFRQTEESMTRKHGGNGLGLAICKGLLDLMGGTIGVESELNKGSRFFFRIPYKISEKLAKKFSPKQIPVFDFKGINILVVEDDPFSIEFLSEILRESKANLMFAHNGTEAIDIFRKNADLDLILLDIQLPDFNGYDVSKKIKELNPDMPIIAQTAFAMADDREKCLKAGCNDYISKPIDKLDLFQRINKVLDNKKGAE